MTPGGKESANASYKGVVQSIPNLGALATTGAQVCGIVWDSDIGINDGDIGNLKGEKLGVVAFEVLSVFERTDSDASSDSLDGLEIKILDAEEVCFGEPSPEEPGASDVGQLDTAHHSDLPLSDVAGK